MPVPEPVPQVELQLANDWPWPADAAPAAWIEATLRAAGANVGPVAVGLRVVDNDESAQLNERFRQTPRPTNVLAFPAPAVPGLPPGEFGELGDLVVCWPVLAAEAGTQGKTTLAHLAHLVVHGTLHLLGFDHEQVADASRMEKLEADVLAGFGFDDPYCSERD